MSVTIAARAAVRKPRAPDRAGVVAFATQTGIRGAMLKAAVVHASETPAGNCAATLALQPSRQGGDLVGITGALWQGEGRITEQRINHNGH
jgi:hypothetical protein